jgi:hypothetical protein
MAFFFVHIFKTVPVFRYFMESLLRLEDTPSAVVMMLPLAYSMGVLLNAWLHWRGLVKKYLTEPTGIRRTFFESISASFGIGIVSYGILNVLSPHFSTNTTLGVFSLGVIAGVGGIVAGIIILYGLGSEPFFDLVSALRKKFWNADIVVVEGQE